MSRPANGTELSQRARALPAGESVLTLPYDREWRVVAVYAKTNEGGVGATVSVCRMPAMFYRIQAGELILTTGSSAHDLAHGIASAFADGVLALGA